MREFARLYNDLDTTTATSRKLDALKKYFSASESANAAWAVYFLAGGKPRQVISTKLLRQFSTEMSGIPESGGGRSGGSHFAYPAGAGI
jgi:DNA ligase-1